MPVKPDVFAAVMATGIVSVAAHDHHYWRISDGLVIVAGTVFVALVVISAVAAVRLRGFPFGDAGDPDVIVGLFTFVAACAVLGARLESYAFVIWLCTAIAWVSWSGLTARLARAMLSRSWLTLRNSAHGAWELASVAASGLTIVTSHLAALAGNRGLWWAALATWLCAIGVYALMTSLIVWRGAVTRSDDAWRPDSWILMGGLAIGTLAGERLHLAAEVLVVTQWLTDAVRAVTVVTWVLASLWIPVLVFFGLKRINAQVGALLTAGAWWAMVFPLGMYSSATFATSLETGWQPLHTVSLVVFWVAFVVWVVVAVSALMSLRRVAGTAREP